jgi:hypothetical protein
MKRNLKVLFVSTLIAFSFSQGFAQDTQNGTAAATLAGTFVQCKFVDNNNNGICDNHELKGSANKCASFTDKDGNGICDNCPKNSNAGKNANCRGNQYGKNCAQGQGNCCGRGPCAGKGQGKCCTNLQGTTKVTPSVTPDPKK